MFGSLVCPGTATERKDTQKWKEIRSAYRILTRKCQEIRPLKRTCCKL